MDRFIFIKQEAKGKEGSMSQWIPVTSGIPQGSVLGPILFVLLINDMPCEIMNTCKLFADDAKMFCNPFNAISTDYHNGPKNGSCL